MVNRVYGKGVSNYFLPQRGFNRLGAFTMSDISPEVRAKHWAKTKNLTIFTLIIWFIFSFGIHLFAGSLNNFTFIGFPLGFYMAAQGSLIAFVVILFLFAKQQDAIDREFGVAEDE